MIRIIKNVETSDIGVEQVVFGDYQPTDYLVPSQAQIVEAALEIVSNYFEALVTAGEEYEERMETEFDDGDDEEENDEE